MYINYWLALQEGHNTNKIAKGIYAERKPLCSKLGAYNHNAKGSKEPERAIAIQVELTERRSQPGNFPYIEAFRILSFFTSQSSPDNASPALGTPPLAYQEFTKFEREREREFQFHLYYPWLRI